jgi:hypothetical protein
MYVLKVKKVLGTKAQMSPLALDSDEKKIIMKKPFKIQQISQIPADTGLRR